MITFLVYAYGDLLTINLNITNKRCELQKEYYQQHGNYKGNGNYSDKYVSWLEAQIQALRKQAIGGSFACLSDDNSCEKKCNACKFIENGLKQANDL